MPVNLKKFSIPNFNGGLDKFRNPYLIKIESLSDNNGLKIDIDRLTNITNMWSWIQPLITQPTIFIGGNSRWYLTVIDVGGTEYIGKYKFYNYNWVLDGYLDPIGLYESIKTTYKFLEISSIYYFALGRADQAKAQIAVYDSNNETISVLGGAKNFGGVVDNIGYYNNFLFASIDNRIWWSDYNNFNDWTGGLSGNVCIANKVIDMVSLGESLIVYCEKSIYRLVFVGSPTMFAIEKIVDGIGLFSASQYYSGRSPKVVSYQGVHYFISDIDTRNVFKFDGVSKPVPIGFQIRDMLFTAQGTNNFLEPSVYINNGILKNELVFMEVSSNYPNQSMLRQFFYNINLDCWSYGTYDIGAPTNLYTFIGRASTYLSPPFNQEICYIKDSVGYISYVETTAGGSSPALKYIETKIIDMDNPNNYKRLQRIALFYQTPIGYTDAIKIYTTENLNIPMTLDSTYILNPTTSTKYLDLDITSRYFKIRYEAGANSGLSKIDLFYIMRGTV